MIGMVDFEEYLDDTGELSRDFLIRKSYFMLPFFGGAVIPMQQLHLQLFCRAMEPCEELLAMQKYFRSEERIYRTIKNQHNDVWRCVGDDILFTIITDASQRGAIFRKGVVNGSASDHIVVFGSVEFMRVFYPVRPSVATDDFIADAAKLQYAPGREYYSYFINKYQDLFYTDALMEVSQRISPPPS